MKHQTKHKLFLVVLMSIVLVSSGLVMAGTYFPQVAFDISWHFLGACCVRSFGQAFFVRSTGASMSHRMSHGFVPTTLVGV